MSFRLRLTWFTAINLLFFSLGVMVLSGSIPKPDTGINSFDGLLMIINRAENAYGSIRAGIGTIGFGILIGLLCFLYEGSSETADGSDSGCD